MTDQLKLLPREPAAEQHSAARDWSYMEFGKPIGKDASLGCWRVMWDAAPDHSPPPLAGDDADLVARLLAETESGQFTLGGGSVSSDDSAGEFWGNKPILKLRNPDGPQAAQRLTALLAAYRELKAVYFCGDDDQGEHYRFALAAIGSEDDDEGAALPPQPQTGEG